MSQRRILTGGAIICPTHKLGLRQLRHSRRSLDAESAATLVHAFVASRIDYCNAVLGVNNVRTNIRVQ